MEVVSPTSKRTFRIPIALTIEAGDDIDLLNTKLDLTPQSDTVEHQHSWTEYSTQYLIAAGVLFVLFFIWRLARQRKVVSKAAEVRL